MDDFVDNGVSIGDLSFFDEPVEPSVETPPTNEPAQEPPPSFSVSPDEWQATQAKLQAMERWKQDAARFFGGGQNEVPINQQPNKEELLAQFVQDPNAVLGGITQQAVQLAAQQMQNEALINEYRSKNPDLVPYEKYVSVEVNEAMAAAAQEGKYLSPKDALEAGIASFRSKFQSGMDQAAKQNQAQEMGKNLLKLDLGSPTPPAGKLTPEQIWSMPQEQFEALEQRFNRQHYL